jgi:hypothetical protein
MAETVLHAYGREYDWLIPHNRHLLRLYQSAERRPLLYQVTKPLWIARYYWLRRDAASWNGCPKCAATRPPASML